MPNSRKPPTMDYAASVKTLKEAGQTEAADKFFETAPEYAEATRRINRRIADSTALPEKPAVLMDGSGGYVFERVDDKTFKIVQSPHGEGGQVVTADSSPKMFSAIQQDVARVKSMQTAGQWDYNRGVPKFEAPASAPARRAPKAQVATGEMEIEAMPLASPPVMARVESPSAPPAVAPGFIDTYERPSLTGRVLSAMTSSAPVDPRMERVEKFVTAGHTGGPDPRYRAFGEAVSGAVGDYRRNAQIQSFAQQAERALVDRNKLDPKVARTLVETLMAQGDGGFETLKGLSAGAFGQSMAEATRSGR